LAIQDRQNNQYNLGILYGALGGLCLGLGGPMVRFVSADTSAWQMLTWRSCAFSVLMLSVALIRSGGFRALVGEIRQIGPWLLPIALSVAVGQISYVLAMLNTTVANTTFVLGTAPLFTAFAAWILLGERLSLKSALILSVALIGVSIMVIEGVSEGRLTGNLYALTAMLTYSVYVLMLRKTRHIDTFVASGVGGLMACTFAATLAFGDIFISGPDMGLSMAMGVIQLGAGFAFTTLALQRIPAAEATLLILLEAIVGPLLVWWLVDEVPSMMTLAGGLLTLACVTAYALIALKSEPVPNP
jgi:drug/metabolite transporter (DMT)-like permease